MRLLINYLKSRIAIWWNGTKFGTRYETSWEINTTRVNDRCGYHSCWSFAFNIQQSSEENSKRMRMPLLISKINEIQWSFTYIYAQYTFLQLEQKTNYILNDFGPWKKCLHCVFPKIIYGSIHMFEKLTKNKIALWSISCTICSYRSVLKFQISFTEIWL